MVFQMCSAECALAVVLIVLAAMAAAMAMSAARKDKSKFGGGPPSPLWASGWRVLLSPACGWCAKQREDLPQGFEGAYTCGAGAPAEACSAAKAFPHWYNVRTGQTRTGYADGAELERMSAAAAARAPGGR